MAVKILKLDDDGRIALSGGRAVVVTGGAARAQCVRERLYLERGDDPFRPGRGVDWSTLKAARATPTTAALSARAELEREPLVVQATVTPVDDGYRTRSVQAGEPWRVWALSAEVVYDGEQSVVEASVEVPLG